MKSVKQTKNNNNQLEAQKPTVKDLAQKVKEHQPTPALALVKEERKKSL